MERKNNQKTHANTASFIRLDNIINVNTLTRNTECH